MAATIRHTTASTQNVHIAGPTILRLIEPHDSTSHRNRFAEAVRLGLQSRPRTLPWGYFYDEAGSMLFEAICTLPEYYLTRTEDAILRRYASAMIDGMDFGEKPDEEPTLIELGSGSALKTQRLIAAALQRYGRLHYVPIDVSPSALESSAQRLVNRYPPLRVTGYVADYRRGLERILAQARGPRLVLFLGSSLGNYEMDAAAVLLATIRQVMKPQDRLLLGTDIAKDRAVLEAAYDDAKGVTAAFNLNLLHRINRELDADFPVEAFKHTAVYRADRGRVEMHLVCTRELTVRIAAASLTVHFLPGERIHTESSHKYTPDMLSSLRAAAGFHEEATWMDNRGWFQVQRWRPLEQVAA